DHVEMIVVDGSESWLWHRVDAAFGTGVLHLRVDPTLAFLNGKVAGVTTGVHAASHEFVVIADDDVRYDLPALQRLCRLLEHAKPTTTSHSQAGWCCSSAWSRYSAEPFDAGDGRHRPQLPEH